MRAFPVNRKSGKVPRLRRVAQLSGSSFRLFWPTNHPPS
jgi:hypothetical protein